MISRILLAFTLFLSATQSRALAEIVEVRISGTVLSNFVSGAPLDAVDSGDAVTVTFRVDSNDFVDGIPGDTRGYEIIASSFTLEFDTPVSMELLNPFPSGQLPFFTLVESFPVSDGFFISTNPNSPGGVPLAQEPINLNHSLGYEGSTLADLEILNALGTYDFTGLTSFGLNLWAIVPDNVGMEMDFEQMTLSLVDGPIVYCDANPNNSASIAISTTDSSSASIDVVLGNGPANQFVYLLVGDGNGTVSQPPGAKGDLCIVGGSCLGRYDKDVGQIGTAGSFSTDIASALSTPCAGAVTLDPGSTWNFQYWHRQPMGQPATFSKALSVTFQ